MEELKKTSRKMERDLCRDGCVGVNLERKDEYLEQLQRQRQKRTRIIQDGGTRRDRRKARDVLKQLREEREEEHEARVHNEETQQNLEEAHARASETERKLCRVFGKLHALVGTRIGATALRHG